jgi:hypothetical protein
MLRHLKQTDRLLLTLLLIAFVLRCAVVVVRRDNLSIDRDAYLAIAENLVAGNGFCSVVGQPTAFRPPLYPLLLAACLSLGGTIAIAVVQIGLGTATVGLTWRLARNAGLARKIAFVAGLLVAVDPLLLELTSQPMTETLFAFLTTALLCSLTRPTGLKIERPIVSGVLFGLAALCRPSIWAFGGLWIGFVAIRIARSFFRKELSAETVNWRGGITVAIVAVAVVSPWALRNWSVFGRPILMTTHGGYTLALGNNEFFDADVVSGRERVWSGDSLRKWKQDSERRLAEAGVRQGDELTRDAALSRQAVEWIRAKPSRFVAACWLRVKRFWAVRPQRQDTGSENVSFAIGLWYTAVTLAGLGGLLRHRTSWGRWTAGILLALSLTALHTVYWSNMRMRSPLVPVVSVFAASVILTRQAWANSDGVAGVAKYGRIRESADS